MYQISLCLYKSCALVTCADSKKSLQVDKKIYFCAIDGAFRSMRQSSFPKLMMRYSGQILQPSFDIFNACAILQVTFCRFLLLWTPVTGVKMKLNLLFPGVSGCPF